MGVDLYSRPHGIIESILSLVPSKLFDSLLQAGTSNPPWGNDAFSPCFRFTHISEKLFRLCGKFSWFYFSEQMFRFSSAKISDELFFSHRLQISNFPHYFRRFSTFPPISEKLFPPYFCKFPQWFRKIYVILHTFCVFRFPPSLTMMHLCITKRTYWMPLIAGRHTICYSIHLTK